MGGLIVIGFVAAFATILWSAYVVVSAARLGSIGRYAFITIGLAIAVVAYFTTYEYDYFPNKNTHIHGWPVPVVIFQRVDENSHWDDFVGPTTLLGLPMNFIIFMLGPAVALLAIACLRTWQANRSSRLTREPVVSDRDAGR